MSAERIDHVRKARRNIEGLHEYQSEEGMSDASMLTVAIEAQVHATLALVEQQRIANLIALVALSGNENVQESSYDEGSTLSSEGMHALIEYERTPGNAISDPDNVPVIRPAIREALGLGS